MMFTESRRLITQLRTGNDEKRTRVGLEPTGVSEAVVRRICDVLNVGLDDLPTKIQERLEESRRRALRMKQAAIQ